MLGHGIPVGRALPRTDTVILIVTESQGRGGIILSRNHATCASSEQVVRPERAHYMRGIPK